MTTLLIETQRAPAAGSQDDEQICSQVRLALASAQPSWPYRERRREERHPFPYPIYLTPLGPLGEGATVVVLGKHLSEHGLDFYHREPLPYRRVIASLACGSGQWAGLILELSWCRFCRHGWYENGGRFLGATRSPLEEVDERALLDL